MKRFSFKLFLTLACCLSLSISSRLIAQEAVDNPIAAQANADFAVQGEYAGPNFGLQVIARGGGDFEIVTYAGGLPGEGWDRTPPTRVEGDAETVAGIVKSKSLKRVDRKSPTLGATRPQGAIVLFDGTKESLEKNWQSGARITDDGLLMQGATTKATFGDYTLHIEFRTPFQPKAEGQGRGNSGVYHQGRYETQVLDSFGLAGKNNETGGIYEIRDPDLNMCFPPLAWQTYDIDFTAPRFDASGKKTVDAKLTVRLNGVTVQQDTPVPHVTRAAPLAEGNSPGPIHLQDHGNPVRYRNIWLVERNAEREARRPIVPGADRFAADEVTAGRVLIAQLGCAACHATEDALLARKQAPILDSVGGRVRPDALLAISSDAHAVKPGTTMPDLFHGLSEQERRERGAALASFLATTGSIVDRPGDTAAIERGEQLYHSIGCIACHAPRRGDHNLAASSVPLGNLTAKYTVDSLSKFLINPHAVRPTGNMPRLVNGLTEARDLACYLLGKDIVGVGAEQFAATVYHGSWDKLPNFAELQPVKEAQTLGLDLSIAGRRDNFAIVFEAFLPIANAGQYTFHIASDDGSRLLIDGEEVVKVDGVHPRTERAGRKRLTAGIHKVRVEYFEGGGEEVLSLEVEGADFGRSPINMLITSDEKGEVKRELIPAVFKPDSSLAEKGRDLFTRSGCANCHALKTDGGLLTGEIKAPPLALVKADKGCLAGDVPRGLPQYELTWNQRSSIAAALKAIASPLKEDEQIHLQLAGKNCYACHSRGTLGGPEPVRDPMFLTKTQEMGNEGRVPPPLTGVGDKLKPEVIDSIIADGAKDRPYMLTRMPAFGRETTPGLREKLVAVDRREGAAHTLPGQDSPDGKQLISSGRKLVGGEGLACIKCHVFGNKATPGIQAMDLLKMNTRLRDDWFRRYMLAPAEYRPGTRMPLSFPDGKSVLSSVLDGDAHKQIDAMWMYLAQGKDARPPAGIDAEAIILSADAKPVIYRNFIEGLTPRGIAVGYPERVNIAWDANRMALRLLWKNEFIDASKHWVGRGPGFQGPLGDFAVNIETDSPLARLAADDAPWPAKTDREAGYKFLGYSLDPNGRPTFRYRLGVTEVEETPIPAVGDKGLSIVKRQFKVRSRSGGDKLVLRAAVGNIAAQADGSFRVDDKVTVRCEGVTLQTVTVGGKTELRAVLPADGEIAFTQTIAW